ncbi:hypothetical protein Tco_1238775 [Tanacetum coccineum]
MLGDAYKNVKLKTFKLHHISATSITPFENEVPIAAHMCKVANLSPEPIKSLSTLGKESSSSPQVTDTQPAKKPVATADATQNIDASESVEELGNHPEPVDTEKVIVNLNKGHCKKPLSNFSRIEWFITPNVDPENSRLYKDLEHPAHESQTSECMYLTQPQGL